VKTKLLLAAAACAGALAVAACGSAPGPATTATSTPPPAPPPAGSPDPSNATQSPKPAMSGTKVACDLVTTLSTQVKATLAARSARWRPSNATFTRWPSGRKTRDERLFRVTGSA